MKKSLFGLVYAVTLSAFMTATGGLVQAAVLTPYVSTYELAKTQDFAITGLNAIDAQFDAIFDGLTEQQQNDPLVIGALEDDRTQAKDDFIETVSELGLAFGPRFPIAGPAHPGIEEDSRNAGFMLVGSAGGIGAPFQIETEMVGEVQVEIDEDLTGKTVNVSLSNVGQSGTGPTSFRLTPFLSATDESFEQFLRVWQPFVFHDFSLDITLNEGETFDIDVTDAVLDFEVAQLDPLLNPDELPISFAFMIEALDGEPQEVAVLQAVIDVVDEDLGPVANTRLSGPPSSLLSAVEGPVFTGVDPSVVPVPAAGPLLALGLGAFAFIRRRRGAGCNISGSSPA